MVNISVCHTEDSRVQVPSWLLKQKPHMNTNTCKKCGREIPEHKKFCSQSCSATYNNLKRGPMSDETKAKISKTLKSSVVYKVVSKICPICGKEFIQPRKKNGRLGNAKYCSKECKNKALSLINKQIGSGGFREGSVKNYKSGWFNGIHCDSSWELAFLIYHRDHNVNITRCAEIRDYEFEGKIHKFHPDFVINGEIFEIKGINDKVNQAKQHYNPDVKFLYKKDLEKYIDYAVETYGKFTDLYEVRDK